MTNPGRLGRELCRHGDGDTPSGGQRPGKRACSLAQTPCGARRGYWEEFVAMANRQLGIAEARDTPLPGSAPCPGNLRCARLWRGDAVRAPFEPAQRYWTRRRGRLGGVVPYPGIATLHRADTPLREYGPFTNRRPVWPTPAAQRYWRGSEPELDVVARPRLGSAGRRAAAACRRSEVVGAVSAAPSGGIN